jgi:hypothetical protein
LFEPAKTSFPETPVIVKPLVHCAERLGVKLANARGAAAVGNDQAGGAQHPEMLGDCRAADGEIFCEFADGAAGDAQEAEDSAAGRIGEGAKDGLGARVGGSATIQSGCAFSIGNHMVTQIR